MTEGPAASPPAAPTRGAPLRTLLLRVVAAAILPVALMSALGLWMMVEQQREQAERGALELTRAMMIAVDAELQRATDALDVLATSESLDEGNLPSFHSLTQRVMTTQPGWTTLVLADANGRVLINSAYPLGEALPPLAEPESFQQVVQGQHPVVGRLARGYRGQWALPIRVPVIRDGRLRYVLTAAIKPQAIADVLSRQRVPPDWVVSVFDERGQRVARSRGAERFIGMPAAPSLQALMHEKGDEGTGMSTSLEGDEVHTAFVRSHRTGWSIAIGLPPSAVYAGIDRSVAVYAGGLALSMALGLLAAIGAGQRIVRPTRALRDAARAFGRGEELTLPATPVRELQGVADALQAAAQQLQAGAADRSRLYAEAQAARQLAEAANRSKDEFLAMLGHELRNPLAPIVTALRLMALREPDSHLAERRVIERQVTHLTRLVDDLLDVSRFARGKVQLQRQLLDLRDAITRAVEIVQPLYDQRMSALRLQLPPEPMFVSGDPVRLAQVFSNLLSNAAKFTPADGRITLKAAAEGAELVVSVEDAGAGISPELLPRVFDLFVQGQQALDRQAGGLGLGLAIVKTLVELHGGSVTVQSEGEGRGSRFTVRLPRATTAAFASTPTMGARFAPAAHSRRVMVVDDNRDAAETLAMVLEACGHEVRTAPDGPRALALVQDFRPEVGVLDIGLPGMDGYELAKQLRTDPRLPSVRLVAVTGYGNLLDREKALDAGFDEHFVKPVDAETLAGAIDRLTAAEG